MNDIDSRMRMLSEILDPGVVLMIKNSRKHLLDKAIKTRYTNAPFRD